MSVSCLPGAHDISVVHSFTYPVTVGMSYAPVTVVGTGVTTTGQEQLNRCSEWCCAGEGGRGVLSLRLGECRERWPGGDIVADREE